jgi:hypothetical protein
MSNSDLSRDVSYIKDLRKQRNEDASVLDYAE